jgi:heavy metal translocating P-type ATPase
VDKLGYRATVYTGETNQAKTEIRSLLLRLGVAAFLWANIMGFSVVLYVGYFERIATSASLYIPYLLLALATPMVFYSAQPILRAAWMGLRNGQIRMETLLSIGILTAYLFSAVQTLRGHTHLYFDTAAAIVTLVLTGKLIERVAKGRAARSLALLYRFMPKKACLIGAGCERYVSIDALEPGAIFVVKAGERFPADGVLTEGETYADESLLTGESKPVFKRIGSALASGSLNLGGVVHVRASRTSSESALALIIRQVERALSTRAGVERLVDQVSRVFVPIVILLAVVLACAMAMMHLGVEAALMRATTILVIACPCALGLATPLAITAAVGTASQNGLLISDSSVLETMGHIDTMVVDKTGTLTAGEFTLNEFALLDSDAVQVHSGQYPAAESALREQLCAELAKLAALENYSEHLLGRAIRSAARELDLQLPQAGNPEVIKGEGMRGVVEGVTIYIGNRRMAERCGAAVPEALLAMVAEWQNSGMTTAYFGHHVRVRGALAFGDRLKDGAAEMVSQLRARGIRVSMVSGDAEATVRHAAALVGIDEYRAEARPD